MNIYTLFSWFTVFTSGGLLCTNSQDAGENSNAPCNMDVEQMYPHRRSLLHPLQRRQFVSVQVIPGQGRNAPPSTPPRTKYTITEAMIQLGPSYTNGTNTIEKEVFTVVVANATGDSTPATCRIEWYPPAKENTGYTLDCQNSAFCVILWQLDDAIANGFYLYVSLP